MSSLVLFPSRREINDRLSFDVHPGSEGVGGSHTSVKVLSGRVTVVFESLGLKECLENLP